MGGMKRALVGLVVWVLAAMLAGPVCLAQVATTTVQDTIYHADGTAAHGTVIVSWPAFTTPAGQSVPAGSTSATLSSAGALSLNLAPNAGASPIGSYYTAVYHLDDGTISREYWVLPVSSFPVHVSAVRSTVLPTSVAMQTVSKSYVDTAIASAMSGHPLDATGYVRTIGDTMTGPLVLPGDPAAATQAADKHYVDVGVASVQAGLGQKISLVPATTQVVVQPVGTDLEVNRLNGTKYASQYKTPGGNDGIANATASADCASGCHVEVEQTENAGDFSNALSWKAQTQVHDFRGGMDKTVAIDPHNLFETPDFAREIVVESTANIADLNLAYGRDGAYLGGLRIVQNGVTGGNNLFPENIVATAPYFKTTYTALALEGENNSEGQHALFNSVQECFGVGDCLMGSRFLTSSGGSRDNADEGTHPFDITTREDSRVFRGVCGSGCTTGSTQVTVTSILSSGTQGEGRFLLDVNPAKVITAGTLLAPAGGNPYPAVTFAGTSFPVSTFFTLAQGIPPQAHNMAPGTVTVAIATTGVTSGFARNTASAPSGSGVACVVDQQPFSSQGGANYEMAVYTVTDGTHFTLTLNKPHANRATVSIGGLCGYGLEQTVDTLAGIRQVFPVIGSTSATQLYYLGSVTPILAAQGSTSAYVNVSLAIASAARTGNVVTLTAAGNMPHDLNGLTLTVAGVTDSSYNGSFVVTTTGPNTITFAQTGANSTSSGGTVGMFTGGYALYQMAEVIGVLNATTKQIDGKLTLAPNTVAWAAGDALEQPHYYIEQIYPDTEVVQQFTPRPTIPLSGGINYENNNGPGLRGWTIANNAPAANYYGNGGTHTVPDAAYVATGPWMATMDLQAGDRALFAVHCNSHGCGRWNSAFDLFELDRSTGGYDTVVFDPNTSLLSIALRGTGYSFSPTAFTAGTINATTVNAVTVNATTLHGTVAVGSLPVFQASGAGHSAGAVPDAGATAGTTRFLREDGTWSAPAGGGGVTTAGGVVDAVATYSGGSALQPTSIAIVGDAVMTTDSNNVDLSNGGNGVTFNANDVLNAVNGQRFDGSQITNLNPNNLFGTIPQGAMPMGFLQAIATKTSAYTMSASDYTIRCDATAAAVTITLPSSVTGHVFNVKKVDSSAHACVVSGGGHNIDGATTVTLGSANQVVRVQGDPASGAWNVL